MHPLLNNYDCLSPSSHLVYLPESYFLILTYHRLQQYTQLFSFKDHAPASETDISIPLPKQRHNEIILISSIGSHSSRRDINTMNLKDELVFMETCTQNITFSTSFYPRRTLKLKFLVITFSFKLID